MIEYRLISHEPFFANDPANTHRREISPTVVTSEFRRAIGPERSRQQVPVAERVIYAREVRCYSIEITFVIDEHTFGATQCEVMIGPAVIGNIFNRSDQFVKSILLRALTKQNPNRMIFILPVVICQRIFDNPVSGFRALPSQ